MIEVVQKTSVVGDYITVDAAARVKGTTYPSLYKYIKRHDVPHLKLGSNLLVRLIDLQGYRTR